MGGCQEDDRMAFSTAYYNAVVCVNNNEFIRGAAKGEGRSSSLSLSELICSHRGGGDGGGWGSEGKFGGSTKEVMEDGGHLKGMIIMMIMWYR